MSTYNAVLAALLPVGIAHKGWICVAQTATWATYEFDFGTVDDETIRLQLTVFKKDSAILQIVRVDADGDIFDEGMQFPVDGDLARQMTQHTFN